MLPTCNLVFKTIIRHISIIEFDEHIFNYMLESFLTGETYRDSKDPILTELHRMEVDKLEKRRTVKMGVCYFLEQ